MFFLSGAVTLQAEEGTFTVVPVTDNIFMIAGKGGNVGLFTGPDGTFLIDDNYAPMTDKLLEAIKSTGGAFPKFLLNTHYHGDHTGGNENLGEEGTLIFAHDNVRERLKNGAYIAPFKAKLEPAAPEGLPVVTFADGISFHINGDTVVAAHTANAHTDGDSFITFEKSNVIHAGDLFFNGFYPFIDVSHGGSLRGTIRGVDEILSRVDDKTRIIPGHGPLADRVQLEEYREMLWTAYERLRKLKADGKTAEEAVAEKPLADLEETWGDGLFSSEKWISLIYSGV